MINPDTELDRLRWQLNSANWQHQEIDEICYMASEEINSVIMDVMDNAVNEAISHAETIGAEEFLSDIDIIQHGSVYRITTRSGSMDYSRDRVENLPNLLRNGKISADGSKYKVIPLNDKEKVKPSINMFETMRQQQRINKDLRASANRNASSRSARANSMMDQLRQSIVSNGRSANSTKESGPVSQFRTASDKQDSKSSWVIPEKDMDMTMFLMNLNDRITDTIDSAISTIIESYIAEYA
jgi:hypothetical protein